MIDLIKGALENKTIDALMELYVDHKKYGKAQGMDSKYQNIIYKV